MLYKEILDILRKRYGSNINLGEIISTSTENMVIEVNLKGKKYICKILKTIKNVDITINKYLIDEGVSIVKIEDTWVENGMEYILMDYITNSVAVREIIQSDNVDRVTKIKYSRELAYEIHKLHHTKLKGEFKHIISDMIGYVEGIKAPEELKYNVINDIVSLETIGYVHGDINSMNILVDTDNDKIVLIDIESLGAGYIPHEISAIYGETFKINSNVVDTELREAFMDKYSELSQGSSTGEVMKNIEEHYKVYSQE